MRRPILLAAGTLAGLAGTLLADPGTRAQLLDSPTPLGAGRVAKSATRTSPAPAGTTTPSPATAPAPASNASARSAKTSPATASTATTNTAPTSAAPTSPATMTRTVDGQPATIPYGVVQVRLIITGSTITDVQALQLPNADGHSQGLAQLAVPQLRQQVLSAQSAQINGVSGATYTSGGYAQSVQSALDSIGGHP